MRQSGTRLARLATWVLLAGLWVIARPPETHAQGVPVPPQVEDEVNRDGVARVIVELRLPAGRHVPEGRLATVAARLAQRQHIASVRTRLLTRLQGTGHRVLHRYASLPFVTLEIGPDAMKELAASGGQVTRVIEDKVRHASLAESVPLIGADQVWARGFDGRGTVVAVLDTGVDSSHPFLRGRVIEEACYSTTSGSSSSLCPNGQEEQTGPGAGANCDPNVLFGCEHGAHVAGIAAGNGDSGGVPFSGVAKGAGIMAVQVFSRFNRFQDCGWFAPCLGAWDSDVIAALERVYELRNTYRFAAVNMSLGGGSFTAPCDTEPYKPAIDNLRSVDIATVIASGNDSTTNALSSPACISTAVSVGSTEKDDTVSYFSNSASFLSLLAPGGSILSSIPGGDYEELSGTSMAAPHVAGGFALLKQAKPDATVDDLLAALAVGGLPITDTRGGVSITKPRIRLAQALANLSPGVPFIDSITPGVGITGSTLSVTISGANFESGATASFGNGVTVNGTTVNSATDLRVNITIAWNATFGFRDVAVSNPGGQTATRSNGFKVVPPPPTMTLGYLGKIRDKVRQSATTMDPDGVLDAALAVTVQSTLGVSRSVTSLELRRSDGARTWDTLPTTGAWILGATAALDGLALNAGDGTVAFPVADGQTFYVFAADASPRLFVGGASFVLTAHFADGSTATLDAAVPQPTIVPNAIDLAAPPGTFAVTGVDFMNLGFGLPIANFVRNGAVVAQARATAMTATALTVPYPTAATALPGNGSLPGLSAGPITVQVYLQTGSSSYEVLGSTTLAATDTRGVAGITPGSIDLAAPPATFTITGGGFMNPGYGLPIANFVKNGAVVAQARATAMTATSLTVPYPTTATALPGNGSLPGLSAGAITVQVYLQTGSSTYSVLGSTGLTVTDSRPPAGVAGITPSAIDLATPPATFTITGGGFANQGYGLPIANFMKNGAVVAQARATAMTATTLTVPYPTAATALPGNGSLPGLSTGAITVQVYLQTGSTTYSVLGSTALAVTDTRGVAGITPSSIDLATPPATFAITGGGFANQGYGLPIANFVKSGAVVAQARATAMTATSLTVPYPTAATALPGNSTLPGLSAGAVTVQVYLQTGASSYSLLGSTPLTVQ